MKASLLIVQRNRLADKGDGHAIMVSLADDHANQVQYLGILGFRCKNPPANRFCLRQPPHSIEARCAGKTIIIRNHGRIATSFRNRF